MIHVAGATGKVGREVVRALRERGHSVRALVRDARRASEILGRSVAHTLVNFLDPSSLRAGLDGARKLFLAVPLLPELAAMEIHLIDAAAAAGVRHIVKLSTLGVGPAVRPGEPRQYALHRASEAHLERSGVAFTHLRPGPFMQNMLQVAPSLLRSGTYTGGWGDAAIPWIDVRDIAAVGATVLERPGHEGHAYALTGPELLTHDEIARELSAATGRSLTYHDIPPEQARLTMISRGMPEWLAGTMAEMMVQMRRGRASVTDTVRRITGMEPRTFAAWARENVRAFAKAA
jgi:uncharacterized protein YbjT (DUF2867 family)